MACPTFSSCFRCDLSSQRYFHLFSFCACFNTQFICFLLLGVAGRGCLEGHAHASQVAAPWQPSLPPCPLRQQAVRSQRAGKVAAQSSNARRLARCRLGGRVLVCTLSVVFPLPLVLTFHALSLSLSLF